MERPKSVAVLVRWRAALVEFADELIHGAAVRFCLKR